MDTTLGTPPWRWDTPLGTSKQPVGPPRDGDTPLGTWTRPWVQPTHGATQLGWKDSTGGRPSGDTPMRGTPHWGQASNPWRHPMMGTWTQPWGHPPMDGDTQPMGTPNWDGEPPFGTPPHDGDLPMRHPPGWGHQGHPPRDRDPPRMGGTRQYQAPPTPVETPPLIGTPPWCHLHPTGPPQHQQQGVPPPGLVILGCPPSQWVSPPHNGLSPPNLGCPPLIYIYMYKCLFRSRPPAPPWGPLCLGGGHPPPAPTLGGPPLLPLPPPKSG